MGVPAAIFAVAAGASLFGGGLKAAGQVAEGKALRAAAQYRAGILQRNAAFSRTQAAAALTRGDVQVQRQQVVTSQFIGRQRAALAASGILVDEGSAVNLQADTAYVGRQEEQDIRFNAEQDALYFNMQAYNAEADAVLTRFTGEQQLKAAKRAVLPTLLTSVGNVGMQGVGAFA